MCKDFVSANEVQGICLVKTLLLSFCMQTAALVFTELTNYVKKAINSFSEGNLLLYGLHPTTATDLKTWPVSLN
jgi:hypothetical protein